MLESLDDDIDDIHENLKNKEKIDPADPLEALKSLKIKDSADILDNNDKNDLQSKYAYDDLDEKLNKKLDDLDKESLDFFSNPQKHSKHSRKESEEDDNIEEKSSLDDDDETADIFPQKNNNKRKILNKLKEEIQLHKPKKFSDEDLDEVVDENEKTAPKFQEIHHSQAYLKHLDQIKKQKQEDDMIPPSKKDPVFGTFMKNLQNIASGSNDSLCKLRRIYLYFYKILYIL